jgi:hypothetical protein
MRLDIMDKTEGIYIDDEKEYRLSLFFCSKDFSLHFKYKIRKFFVVFSFKNVK